VHPIMSSEATADSNSNNSHGDVVKSDSITSSVLKSDSDLIDSNIKLLNASNQDSLKRSSHEFSEDSNSLDYKTPANDSAKKLKSSNGEGDKRDRDLEDEDQSNDVLNDNEDENDDEDAVDDQDEDAAPEEGFDDEEEDNPEDDEDEDDDE